jgi:hypothetical protein
MSMTAAVRGTVIAQYRQVPGVPSLYSGVLSRVYMKVSACHLCHAYLDWPSVSLVKTLEGVRGHL